MLFNYPAMLIHTLSAVVQATPEELKKKSVEIYNNYIDFITKTAGNISPLYRLDAFDWTVLTLYFGILAVLAVYGAYRIKQVVDFWRYHRLNPQPAAEWSERELPRITVQLPLFNEMYVVERLLKAVTEIDYPREKLQIQVLDDSTDETVKLGRATVEAYARK